MAAPAGKPLGESGGLGQSYCFFFYVTIGGHVLVHFTLKAYFLAQGA